MAVTQIFKFVYENIDIVLVEQINYQSVLDLLINLVCTTCQPHRKGFSIWRNVGVLRLSKTLVCNQRLSLDGHNAAD